jgi:hypothetical protein
MAALSDYAENKLLDHVLGTASFTMPTQCYLALYTTATDDAAGGTEVTNANAYVRQAVDFDAASGGATDLTADLTFPTTWRSPTRPPTAAATGCCTVRCRRRRRSTRATRSRFWLPTWTSA